MHIRCPHCHNAVEIVGEQDIAKVSCPSCGSAFDLLPETTSYFLSKRSIGHFELLDELGTGGYGTVWKARDTQLDRLVAIKVPRLDHNDPQYAELFLREARAAAQLRHPHIVGVHEVGRQDGTLYIVSDFICGITLADRLTQGPFPPREAAELLATVAEALHHAHEAGVIHRDLKPQNIMLDGDGRALVMDFGLAKREAGEITMTIDGKILGTVQYMSPEQAKGKAHEADRRSDVYSLGVILFELLTGERPFRGNTRMLLHQVIHDDPPSPRKLNSRVPRDLETICLKAIAKEPARRFSTAQDMAVDVGRFLRGEPILARPVGRPEKVWRWCRRNPTIAGLTTAVALSLIAVSVLSILFGLKSEQERKISERLRQASEQARQDLAKEQTATARERDDKDKALRAEHRARDQALAALRAMTDVMVEEQLARARPMTDGNKTFLRETIKLYEAFTTLETDDIDSRRIRADGNSMVGLMHHRLGDLREAEQAYRTALATFNQIAGEYPTRSDFQKEAAKTECFLAELYTETGRLDDAEAAYGRALNIERQLVKEFKDEPDFRHELALTLASAAGLIANTDQSEKAEVMFREALDINMKLVAQFSEDSNYSQDLAINQYNLAILLRANGRLQEAEDSHDAHLGL